MREVPGSIPGAALFCSLHSVPTVLCGLGPNGGPLGPETTLHIAIFISSFGDSCHATEPTHPTEQQAVVAVAALSTLRIHLEDSAYRVIDRRNGCLV